MSTKSHASTRQVPAGAPSIGFETAVTAWAEAADRSERLLAAGLRAWEAQSALFVEDLLAQGQSTFARLCACKTPLDVLQVEQDWMRARSKSYLESGLRFADAFASVARDVEGDDAQRKAAAAALRAMS